MTDAISNVKRHHNSMTCSAASRRHDQRCTPPGPHVIEKDPAELLATAEESLARLGGLIEICST
jgi:hypothetical protein